MVYIITLLIGTILYFILDKLSHHNNRVLSVAALILFLIIIIFYIITLNINGEGFQALGYFLYSLLTAIILFGYLLTWGISSIYRKIIQ